MNTTYLNFTTVYNDSVEFRPCYSVSILQTCRNASKKAIRGGLCPTCPGSMGGLYPKKEKGGADDERKEH